MPTIHLAKEGQIEFKDPVDPTFTIVGNLRSWSIDSSASQDEYNVMRDGISTLSGNSTRTISCEIYFDHNDPGHALLTEGKTLDVNLYPVDITSGSPLRSGQCQLSSVSESGDVAGAWEASIDAGFIGAIVKGLVP